MWYREIMHNKNLPLVDLHRHLDGNIRADTIWQLAQQHNIALPATEFKEFLPHVSITENQSDLLAFLKKLDWGGKVLKSLDDCKRIAYENVEDVFNAGIDYAELRFSPFYMAMTHQLPIQDVVAVDLAGDEFNFPGQLFIPHFKQVRDAGLKVTIHAGEAAGPESVWQAITELGASRIGHGVNSYHDARLLE